MIERPAARDVEAIAAGTTDPALRQRFLATAPVREVLEGAAPATS